MYDNQDTIIIPFRMPAKLEGTDTKNILNAISADDGCTSRSEWIRKTIMKEIKNYGRRKL